MKREIMKTNDGSFTIHLPEINEQYHSKHGALQESLHVFIDKGLKYISTLKTTKTSIDILEIGFGTGLNTLLTYRYAKENDLGINYTGIEAFPVTKEEWIAMDYGSFIDNGKWNSIYTQMHKCGWQQRTDIDTSFKLRKEKIKFEDIQDITAYDLIYFDAFGARVQPELWTEAIFKIMYNALKQNGVLVTYAAKGSVRRAMQAVGFNVERLEGPPGKREMLRATKK